MLIKKKYVPIDLTEIQKKIYPYALIRLKMQQKIYLVVNDWSEISNNKNVYR